MNTLIRQIVVAFIVLGICGCSRKVDSRQGNSPERSQSDHTNRTTLADETAEEVAWRRGSEQIEKLGGFLCDRTPWEPGRAYVLSFGKAFSDKGLEQLARLPEIGKLDLRDTQVTDAGLSHVEDMPQLQLLYLENTRVTDAGLQHLEVLTRLEHLSLKKTQVTDSGLEHVKKLTQLRSLDVQHTRVTADGIERLQQDLPNCKIRRSAQTQQFAPKK
jgi:hypothetical protein